MPFGDAPPDIAFTRSMSSFVISMYIYGGRPTAEVYRSHEVQDDEESVAQ